MSHLNSFLDAPLRADRGRRLIPTTSLYQQPSTGDYLHDHRPLNEQVTPLVGAATLRPQRFHRGFYRRSEAAIGVSEARQRAQADREARSEEIGRQRRAVLMARQRQTEDERAMCQHKRHFTQQHDITTPPYKTTPPQQPAVSLPSTPPTPLPLLPRFTATSRVIGAGSGGSGSSDVLGSYGVMDAFMGDGYGRLDWQPAKPARQRLTESKERRTEWEEWGGAVGVGVGVGAMDVLGDARRQRQVEYARNARQGSQLTYLFGSSAERAQSV